MSSSGLYDLRHMVGECIECIAECHRRRNGN